MAKVKNKLQTINFEDKNDREVLSILLGNLEISPLVAKHITKCMGIREILIESHKQYS